MMTSKTTINAPKFFLFRWFDRFQDIFLFRLFYWGLRIGLGLAFVGSGLRKMPGVKFTALPPSDPVGAYFEAMHNTGFYWNFIGYFQILLGVMVMINRFTAVSAMLMFPITINLFLVSVSLHMGGTPVITSLMVLGNLFLLIWHRQNFLPILARPAKNQTRLFGKKSTAE